VAHQVSTAKHIPRNTFPVARAGAVVAGQSALPLTVAVCHSIRMNTLPAVSDRSLSRFRGIGMHPFLLQKRRRNADARPVRAEHDRQEIVVTRSTSLFVSVMQHYQPACQPMLHAVQSIASRELLGLQCLFCGLSPIVN